MNDCAGFGVNCKGKYNNIRMMSASKLSLTVILWFLPLICVANIVSSDEESGLMSECHVAMMLRRFDEVRDKGAELARISESSGHKEVQYIAMSYILRANVSHGLYGRNDRESLLSLLSMIEYFESNDPGSEVLFHLYYTLSLYHLYADVDYASCSNYAFKGMEVAERLENSCYEVDCLTLLASIFFLKYDPDGFPYALKAYDIAHETGYEEAYYVTAINLSNYLFNGCECDKALEYLKEACVIAENYDMDHEQSYIKSFFGDIYYKLGKSDIAERYYKEALNVNEKTSVYDRVHSMLRYSVFLYENGRYEEALELLLPYRSSFDGNAELNFGSHILYQISQCQEALGDYREALISHKRFAMLKDSATNAEKERDFSVLDLRYKILEEKNENNERKVQLMEKDKKMAWLLVISSLLAIATFFAVVVNRRTRRLYRHIVQDRLAALEREKLLRKEVERLSSEADVVTAYHSGLGERKAAELYAALEQALRKDRIYRDSELSLEKASAILQTNRTYLSQVVNEKAGCSFSSYVNEYRLIEAMEILSDPQDNRALKTIGFAVGFSTTSHFYSLFKQRVGVTPMVFRQNARM